jgi:hypothetical protein
MAAKIQGFTFYIDLPEEVTGVPERVQIANEFDFISDLLSLPRLPEETNQEFKQRMMDVRVHQGSPLYDGVVNNISRAFGYSRQRALSIDLKTASNGTLVATSPRVDILANKIVLYSDWRPDGTEIIDKEISFYNPTDEGYFVSDLVSEINDSSCFSAALYSGVRPNLHTTNLVRGSSDNSIRGDVATASLKIDLAATYITKGSLLFHENDIFKTEVSSSASTAGEYYVDYENGIIYPYSVPNGEFEISYHFGAFPLIVDYSLIKAYTLQDDNFIRELYNHETSAAGTEVNTLPNEEGSEILHQLFLETRYLWGE